MKRLTTRILAAILATALCAPVAEARNPRPGNDRGNTVSTQNNGQRPSSRQNNSNRNRNNRPNPGNNNNRPDNHRPQRPDHHAAPAPKPNRPVWHHASRPIPPATWRPRPNAPVLNSVLGLTFGSAFNISLTYLANNGYNVTGYGNDIVHLNNVSECNFIWPEASLYYTNGGLSRSEFINYTMYPDVTRYNTIYNGMTVTYGAPVTVNNGNNGISATWFAPNRGYITLYYGSQYTTASRPLYYTTLTFGL